MSVFVRSTLSWTAQRQWWARPHINKTTPSDKTPVPKSFYSLYVCIICNVQEWLDFNLNLTNCADPGGAIFCGRLISSQRFDDDSGDQSDRARHHKSPRHAIASKIRTLIRLEITEIFEKIKNMILFSMKLSLPNLNNCNKHDYFDWSLRVII